jgi:hypothetical protein
MENQETNPIEDFTNLVGDPEQEIDVLDDEAIFSIPMSGGYAKRLQAVGAWMIESKKPEEILKIYEKIASSEDGSKYDAFTFHLETMLILFQEIEKQAREANAIKKQKIKDIEGLV